MTTTYLIIYHDEKHEVITDEYPQSAIDYLVNKIGTGTIETIYRGDLVSFPNDDGTITKVYAYCTHDCNMTVLTYGDSAESTQKALEYIAEHSGQDWIDWMQPCSLVDFSPTKGENQ